MEFAAFLWRFYLTNMFPLRRALFALAISMAVPACAAQAATITVDRTDDADVSACSTAANDCTLRGAINKANNTASNPGADTIVFASNVRGAIVLSNGQLPFVSEILNITGPVVGALALDGNSKNRIFQVLPGASFTISNLTLRKGAAGSSDDGGAIYSQGNLDVSNCVFDGNSASSGGAIISGTLTLTASRFINNRAIGAGGAIYGSGAVVTDCVFADNIANTSGGAFSGGSLQMNNCSFTSNLSLVSGGGMDVYGPATISNSTFVNNQARNGGGLSLFGNSSTVQNCTITGNSATVKGGGVYTYGEHLLDSVTITDNVAPPNQGGGVAATGGTNQRVEIKNSIVTASRSGGDVDYVFDLPRENTNEVVSLGHNLIGSGNATVSFNQSGDQTGVTDAKLGPLAGNGGATQTIALLAGSPAIDAGQTTLATDQRGVARPQGGAADIGAYELSATPPTTEIPSLIVTTLDDVDANDGQNSLREAINYANSKEGADVITFANNLTGTVRLNAQLPTIYDALTIQGAGASVLAIDGSGARLLRIASNASATINDLTLSGGKFSPDDGRGGAILNEGNLSMNQVAVSNNRGIEGGGIANLNGVLTMTGCLLNNNVALNSGGGILNNNGQVTLINSTVSGNSAIGNTADAAGGGGIDSFGSAATVRLECVTLANNSASNVAGGNRAGVWIEEGALTIHNSVLYGNGTSDVQNEAGTLSSSGYNIFGVVNNNAGLVASDRVGVNPQIGGLADNGGPTFTHALLAGSPAINTGDPNIKDGFDQRGGGFPRVRGGIIDVGAFEVQSDAATPIVSLSPQNPTTDQKLTATPSGFDAGAVYSYLWKKNGVLIPNETSGTLDLSKPGNGDVGDIITVEVTSGSVVRTAGVKVINLNRAPVAFSRNVSATADVEASFELRGSDPDGNAITFEITKAPTNGQAEIKVDPLDGKIKLFYKSRPRFNGVDVIRFVAVDTAGAKSNEATLGIAVKYNAPPVNRAPVAGDTNIDTYVGDSVVKGLLGSDPDGDAITFRIVNNAKYGSSEIKRDTDGFFKLFYTSLNRFYGNDRVTYIAIDSRGKESNLATINIHFINRAPSAQNNTLSVASGELVSQYLFGTDTDNDALTFRLVNNPQYGTGSVKRDEQGNWRVYYQSVPGYVGADRITFIAIDPFGKESQVATANINVVRVGPQPSSGNS